MTAAYRLKGVGWLGACVAIILGFYLVSLQVAAERKKLDDVNARIRSAERDIRALETEFDTRANLAQLEKWNGDTLALTAPVARQFVADETALAAIDVTGGTPGAPAADGARTMTAALVVPSLPAAMRAAVPAAALPAMPASLPVQTAAVAGRPADRPVANPAIVRVASVARVAPIVEARRTEAARGRAAVAKVRPEAVAMLDRKLLSDTTLGDILSRARTEAGHRR